MSWFRQVFISQVNAVVRQKINPLELFMAPINPIWVNYKTQKWFEENLKPNMRVFEYGSGNSTKYIASRVKEIISVESNSKWYNLNKKNSSKNATVILAKSKQKYAKSILKYGLFDIIIIDGEYRYECAIYAQRAIKKNGIIVFDNLEQSNYGEIFESMAGKKIRLKGLVNNLGAYSEAGVLYK